MLLGCHVSMKGNKMLLGSAEEAASYGANCFQIHIGAPQNTVRKPVNTYRIDEAHQVMEEDNIEQVVVHAPYIVNFANPNKEDKMDFYVSFFHHELERAEAIGAKQVVLHPGSHVETSVKAGIRSLVKGLNETLTGKEKLQVSLETMSGKGSEIGKTFEELAEIIEGVNHNDLLSVTMDTCHLNDAGYDVKNDFEGVLDHFDDVIGLDRLKVIHLNDSKNPRGAHKDRHANIGFGTIGFDALNHICHHEKLKEIPKILETPWVPDEENKRHKKAPYKGEIEMLKTQTFNPNLLDEVKEGKWEER